MVKIIAEITDKKKLKKLRDFLNKMGMSFKEELSDAAYLQEEYNKILKDEVKWLSQDEFEDRLNEI